MESMETREGISVGDEVYLALRPEKIHLSVGSVPGNENQTPGVIENIIYMGASTLFHIQVGARKILVAEKNTQPGIAYSVGDSIFLSWPPSTVRILKA